MGGKRGTHDMTYYSKAIKQATNITYKLQETIGLSFDIKLRKTLLYPDGCELVNMMWLLLCWPSRQIAWLSLVND